MNSDGRTSRRDFLGALGAAAAGARVARTGALDRIGIQLYTLRQELAQDPVRTLARVAEIGFREVEFAGYPPGTPTELRALLDRYGLRAPSSHVPLAALDRDWERTLENAAAIGQRYIVVAFVAPADRGGLEDWKRLATRFTRAGETARRHGLSFCYHNHDFEFAQIDGLVPYDLLLAETDPRAVGFEMDLYWLTKGGRDPLEYFSRWPGRFPLVHVKDMDPTPRRGFTEVGKGIIDFRRVFRRAAQAGIRHYFYEQDETPGSPFESAKASYAYLRALRY